MINIVLDKGVDFFTIFDCIQCFSCFTRGIDCVLENAVNLQDFGSISDDWSIMKKNCKAH